MAKLIHKALEENPHNDNAVSRFAYFDSTPTKEDLKAAGAWYFTQQNPDDAYLDDEPGEVPTPVSKMAGLQRWFIGQAG